MFSLLADTGEFFVLPAPMYSALATVFIVVGLSACFFCTAYLLADVVTGNELSGKGKGKGAAFLILVGGIMVASFGVGFVTDRSGWNEEVSFLMWNKVSPETLDEVGLLGKAMNDFVGVVPLDLKDGSRGVLVVDGFAARLIVDPPFGYLERFNADIPLANIGSIEDMLTIEGNVK